MRLRRIFPIFYSVFTTGEINHISRIVKTGIDSVIVHRELVELCEDIAQQIVIKNISNLDTSNRIAESGLSEYRLKLLIWEMKDHFRMGYEMETYLEEMKEN